MFYLNHKTYYTLLQDDRMWKRNLITAVLVFGSARWISCWCLIRNDKDRRLFFVGITNCWITRALVTNRLSSKVFSKVFVGKLNSKRAEVRFKRSWTYFGQDLTYLHVDIADKLVLKLLQYAGNHVGLAQMMSLWEGIRDRNLATQLHCLVHFSKKTGSLFLNSSLFIPYSHKKHKQIHKEPVVESN